MSAAGQVNRRIWYDRQDRYEYEPDPNPNKNTWHQINPRTGYYRDIDPETGNPVSGSEGEWRPLH